MKPDADRWADVMGESVEDFYGCFSFPGDARTSHLSRLRMKERVQMLHDVMFTWSFGFADHCTP